MNRLLSALKQSLTSENPKEPQKSGVARKAQPVQISNPDARLTVSRALLGGEKKRRNEHDRVIDALCTDLLGTRLEWFGNRNLQKDYPLRIEGKRTMYPDGIAVRRNTDRVVGIAEVETAQGLTVKESKQWLRYSRLGLEFVLIVPKSHLERAQELCESANVHCVLWTYSISAFGCSLTAAGKV